MKVRIRRVDIKHGLGRMIIHRKFRFELKEERILAGVVPLFTVVDIVWCEVNDECDGHCKPIIFTRKCQLRGLCCVLPTNSESNDNEHSKHTDKTDAAW